MTILRGFGHSQYGKFMEDMERYFIEVSNNYPVVVAGEFNLLVNNKHYRPSTRKGVGGDGVEFSIIESVKNLNK